MAKNIQQVYVANPITSNASTDLMYFGQSPYGTGDDAAMTYANFSAQFGAAYTAAALTKTDDTNVTLTLGGTPATALLQAASLTLGWTGTLSSTRGGTGVNNGASTITLGGSLTTSGAFSSTFIMTGITSVTFPTSGTLATTGGTVSTSTGTANQVLVNGTSGVATSGAVTLTTPQSLATTAAYQANTVQLNSNNGLLDSNGNIILGLSPQVTSVNYIQLSNGATGVNPALVSVGGDTNINIGVQSKGTGMVRLNSANTTQPINFQTGTGLQHNTFFNFANTSATRTVTFQDANGTVAFTSDIPSVTPAALTKTDDTNVTLTLGGTPATALLQATSITAGWTGTLSVGRGGLGIGTTPTNGMLPIGNGTNYTAATLTAGTGITITNGSGSIAVASNGADVWVDQTTSSVTMAVNTGYTSDAGASLITFTLPATSAIGAFVEINGKGAGGWIIAQASGQQIRVGNVASTLGATGTVASTNQYDCVRLRCITANTIWVVASQQSSGLTIV